MWRTAGEERRLNLDTPQFEEEIGDLSPTRCVPVLWHDARCIWDSLAIAETVAMFRTKKAVITDGGRSLPTRR